MKISTVLFLCLVLSCCGKDSMPPEPGAPVEEMAVATATCSNACPDYSVSWKDECPEGQRCLTFT